MLQWFVRVADAFEEGVVYVKTIHLRCHSRKKVEKLIFKCVVIIQFSEFYTVTFVV